MNSSLSSRAAGTKQSLHWKRGVGSALSVPGIVISTYRPVIQESEDLTSLRAPCDVMSWHEISETITSAVWMGCLASACARSKFSSSISDRCRRGKKDIPSSPLDPGSAKVEYFGHFASPSARNALHNLPFLAPVYQHDALTKRFLEATSSSSASISRPIGSNRTCVFLPMHQPS